MDKSEGTNFFSKMFSSATDNVAKWYQMYKQKMSLAQIKRARSEKLNILGNKVFKAMAAGDRLDAKNFAEEYDAVVRIDKQIQNLSTEIDLIEKSAEQQLKKAGDTVKKAADTVEKKIVAPKKQPASSVKTAAKPTASKAAPKKTAPRKSAPRKTAAKPATGQATPKPAVDKKANKSESDDTTEK